MKGDLMAAEMAEQPEVLARLVSRAGADMRAVRAVLPRPLAGIVFVGRGSSDNAALFGRYLTEMAAGRPAGLAAPSLYTRYRARVSWSGYLVVALSQSGATPEIVTTCDAMSFAGATVLAITNEADSDLAAAADLVLLTCAGPERAVPATKTVTAEMLLMVTVARALGTVGVSIPQLHRLAASIAKILEDSAPIDGLAGGWSKSERLVVTGRGLGYAAALECALKVKETTGILAEGISTADLRHGPIAVMNAGTAALLIDVGGPAARDLEEMRQLLRECGAEAVTLPLGSSLPEPLQVLSAVVRGQQLARSLALLRGRDPDHPATLTKVTATE
jgi:glucosamine--fructose-6-phosphate aminotransferase (isomerizing)